MNLTPTITVEYLDGQTRTFTDGINLRSWTWDETGLLLIVWLDDGDPARRVEIPTATIRGVYVEPRRSVGGGREDPTLSGQ